VGKRQWCLEVFQGKNLPVVVHAKHITRAGAVQVFQRGSVGQRLPRVTVQHVKFIVMNPPGLIAGTLVDACDLCQMSVTGARSGIKSWAVFGTFENADRQFAALGMYLPIL